jgi:hypothetical protein
MNSRPSNVHRPWRHQTRTIEVDDGDRLIRGLQRVVTLSDEETIEAGNLTENMTMMTNVADGPLAALEKDVAKTAMSIGTDCGKGRTA